MMSFLIVESNRWLAAKMRSKIAAVHALNQLAFSHWTEQTLSPVTPAAKSAVVESSSKLITPWVEIAKGADSFECPGVFSLPLPDAQREDIKSLALQLAHSLAMGMQFFCREWCGSDMQKKSGALRRVQSPTTRQTLHTRASMNHEVPSEDLPFKDALLSVLKTIDAAFKSNDAQLGAWMAQHHNLIGNVSVLILLGGFAL